MRVVLADVIHERGHDSEMRVEVRGYSKKPLYVEKLMRVGIACTKCHDIIGWCYITDYWFNKIMGMDFLCMICKKKSQRDFK